MNDRFAREEFFFDEEGKNRIENARVILFGVGGVGGAVLEGLVRAGIGHITIVDSDTFEITNINRQLHALTSTLGKDKTEVAKERSLDINPAVDIKAVRVFYLPETADMFDFSEYDYVIDAVDTVAAKISIIVEAKKNNVPVISAMGAGNKLDATAFKVADIYNTKVCPLARVMRTELKKKEVKDLKVVYSEEIPISTNSRTPQSISFVPPVMGYIIAGEVIKDIAFKTIENKTRII